MPILSSSDFVRWFTPGRRTNGAAGSPPDRRRHHHPVARAIDRATIHPAPATLGPAEGPGGMLRYLSRRMGGRGDRSPRKPRFFSPPIFSFWLGSGGMTHHG